MKKLASTATVVMVLGMVCLIAAAAMAKDKAEKGRLEGFVRNVNHDASSFSLNVSHDTGGLWRTVLYNKGTVFTLRNKPTSLDSLKDGVRVICTGHFDSDARLVADRIEVRTEK